MLIVPIYSMRSYTDNTYSILKDGNAKLHFNRLDYDDYITIPENTADFLEFVSLDLINPDHIIKVKYGENALETRKIFWQLNQDFLDSFNLEIITDITGYTGKHKFYNNFNVSKLLEYPREYVDQFFESDISSIRTGEHTTVLNQCQKDYIVELYLELDTKISVNQKVVSKNYFHKVGIDPFFDFLFTNNKNIIFFPFRISDPCYKFDEVIEKYSNHIIVITDPNNSYSSNYSNVILIKPNKKQYYGILSNRPTIIYNENPDKIFHPGLADFIYFGCTIISDHNIPKIQDVLI